MGLASNPNYQALAATAAAALGNPTQSIVKAILAQWQCEIGANAPWPPPRNNPGNVAKGAADGVGVPYTIQTPNPQPSNPIVTFGSPADGARAYAGGIHSFARYAAARLAIARGDGAGMLVAITAGGYGTNIACALSVYRGETGAVSTSPAPPSTSSSPSAQGTVIEVLARLTSAPSCSQVTILAPANSSEQASGVIPIPRENIGDPCTQCPSGWSPAIVNPGPLRSALPFIGGAWVDPSDVPGQANACVAPGVQPGDNFDAGGALNQAGAAFAGLSGAILGAGVPLLVNGALLILILALAYSGFRDLVD